MDTTELQDSRSTSPFPIIVNSETLSENVSQPGCCECRQFVETVKNAFTQQAALSDHVPMKGCCCRNKINLDFPRYRQKLRWYYECLYCEYQSFHIHEIDSHVLCKHSANAQVHQVHAATPSKHLPSGHLSLSLSTLDSPETTETKTTDSQVAKSSVVRSIQLDNNEESGVQTKSPKSVNKTEGSIHSALNTNMTSRVMPNVENESLTKKAQQTTLSLASESSSIVQVTGKKLGKDITALSQKQSEPKQEPTGKRVRPIEKLTGAKTKSKSYVIVYYADGSRRTVSDMQMVPDETMKSTVTVPPETGTESMPPLSVVAKTKETPSINQNNGVAQSLRTPKQPDGGGSDVKLSIPSLHTHSPIAKPILESHSGHNTDPIKKIIKPFSSTGKPPKVSQEMVSSLNVSTTKDEAPAGKSFLSPVRTLDLFQFSDVLGLKKISEADNLVGVCKVTKRGRARSKKISPSDFIKVTSPYQRVYKTTANRLRRTYADRPSARSSPSESATGSPSQARDIASANLLSSLSADDNTHSDFSDQCKVGTSTCVWETEGFINCHSVPVVASTPQPVTQTISSQLTNSLALIPVNSNSSQSFVLTNNVGGTESAPKTHSTATQNTNNSNCSPKPADTEQSDHPLKIKELSIPIRKLAETVKKPTNLAKKSTGGKHAWKKATRAEGVEESSTPPAAVISTANEKSAKSTAIKSIFSVKKYGNQGKVSAVNSAESRMVGSSLTIPLPFTSSSSSAPTEVQNANSSKSLADTHWHTPVQNAYPNKCATRGDVRRKNANIEHPQVEALKATAASKKVKYLRQASVVLTAERMSPLHISTDLPSRPTATCQDSDSPPEVESNPWPSPDLTSPPPKTGKPVATTPISVSVANTTPLLTFGTTMIAPNTENLSPTPSLALSTTSTRVSPRGKKVRCTKRVTKEMVDLAVTAIPKRYSSSAVVQLLQSAVVSYNGQRFEHVVRYVHDRRAKVVKHACKREPVEIVNDHTGDTDDDTNVWPGPLSDDDSQPPAGVKEVSDSDSEMSYDSDASYASPEEMHPRWSCKHGCKYHTPPSSPPVTPPRCAPAKPHVDSRPPEIDSLLPGVNSQTPVNSQSHLVDPRTNFSSQPPKVYPRPPTVNCQSPEVDSQSPFSSHPPSDSQQLVGPQIPASSHPPVDSKPPVGVFNLIGSELPVSSQPPVSLQRFIESQSNKRTRVDEGQTVKRFKPSLEEATTSSSEDKTSVK